MTVMYDNISGKRIFNDQPNISNYPTVATVISSNIPLSNVFNGMSYLTNLIQTQTKNGTDPTGIQFGQIQERLNFKMYKIQKPNVIYSNYISRKLPDTLNSSAASVYQPTVQFKIDYDACCVGSMMLLLTIDISVRETVYEIRAYNFSATNNANFTTISEKQIKSIQFCYIKDFLYHWINKISLGFANTGGNAPVWHQEIPVEVAKIYHSLILDTGFSDTIRRAVREDLFVIGHDPHKQFGNFSFALKNPALLQTTATTQNGQMAMTFTSSYPTSNAAGGNSAEIAMYWTDTTIKDIGFGAPSNYSDISERNNIIAVLKPPEATRNKLDVQYEVNQNKTKVISKLNGEIETYWKFGTATSNIQITIPGNNYGPFTFNNSQAPLYVFGDAEGVGSKDYTMTKLKSTFENIKWSLPYCNIQTGADQKVDDMEKVFLFPFIEYTTQKVNFYFSLVSATNKGATGGTAFANATTEDQAVQFTMSDAMNNLNVSCKLYGTTDTTILGYGILVASSSMQWDGNAIKVKEEKTTKGVNYKATTENISVLSNGFVSNTDLNDAVVTLSDFMAATADAMGKYIMQNYGAISPLMAYSNLSYINMEIKPYAENDLALYSTNHYLTAGSSSNLESNKYGAFIPTDTNALAVFRYNASILNNAASEEHHPAINNVDSISIHTYRKSHGVIDFYFPLQFLFICESVGTSFPHYACAAQSVIVKFDFDNPLKYIATSISVDPLAIDPVDFNRKERILVNRAKNYELLYSNTDNMKFVLFYSRIVWVPQLIPVLTGYSYYSWVINNYDRYHWLIDGDGGSQQLVWEFGKSNFYTKIFAFIVNKETYESSVNINNVQNDYIPISINKYNLELWDLIRFNTKPTITSQGVSTVNLYNSDEIAALNSVYNLVPVDEVKLETKTQINMTDPMPYRAQMLGTYLMFEHESVHSSLKFNNLLQFNLDSVFHGQPGHFPYCMYSPAYAPNFTIKATLKPYALKQQYGAIVIPEMKNVSYIQKHVMLLKYSTNN